MAPMHTTGSSEEHLAARQLLEAEKEPTRRGDELARRRRELPWVPIEKEYVFDTDDGERTLRELFAGRSQLLVYHFMFGPKWTEGCPICSFWADNFNGAVVHLAHQWASSGRSDFNYDFAVSVADLDAGASQPEMERRSPDRTDLPTYNFTKKAFAAELPGLSAFACEDGVVYHTTAATRADWMPSTAPTSCWTAAPLGVRAEFRRERRRAGPGSGAGSLAAPR